MWKKKVEVEVAVEEKEEGPEGDHRRSSEVIAIVFFMLEN